MWQLLFWVYVVTGALLVSHEIDSASWKEWELFRLPGGPGGFALLHIPLAAVVIAGAALVHAENAWGAVLSLLLAGAGVAAFAIHMAFIRAGRPEFRTAASLTILAGTLVAAIVQAVVAIAVLA